jgi:hypothetical protein
VPADLQPVHVQLPPGRTEDRLPGERLREGNIPQRELQEGEATYPDHAEPRKSVLTKLETEFELQAKAQELLTYMVFLNQTRVYVEPEDIETLIQNDFIGMSEILNE